MPTLIVFWLSGVWGFQKTRTFKKVSVGQKPPQTPPPPPKKRVLCFCSGNCFFLCFLGFLLFGGEGLLVWCSPRSLVCCSVRGVLFPQASLQKTELLCHFTEIILLFWYSCIVFASFSKLRIAAKRLFDLCLQHGQRLVFLVTHYGPFMNPGQKHYENGICLHMQTKEKVEMVQF